jgi:hypothetical protein
LSGHADESAFGIDQVEKAQRKIDADLLLGHKLTSEVLGNILTLLSLLRDLLNIPIRNSSATKRHKRHTREKDGNEPDEASKIDSGSPPCCSRCAFCAFLWLCLRSYFLFAIDRPVR